jgi:hypothetical protein
MNFDLYMWEHVVQARRQLESAEDRPPDKHSKVRIWKLPGLAVLLGHCLASIQSMVLHLLSLHCCRASKVTQLLRSTVSQYYVVSTSTMEPWVLWSLSAEILCS